MAKRYSDEDIAFLKRYYPDEGCHYCAKHLGRDYHLIISKANSLGLFCSKERRLALAIKAREKPLDQYKVDPRQFFDVKTPEAAYFLGLFWADGHVGVHKDHRHPNGVYSFALDIQKADYLSVKSAISRLGEWSISERRRGTWKPSISIRTGNKPLFTFLTSKDYQTKSQSAPTKILSHIPEHLRHYWWRGYFDGDGHISKTRYAVVLAGAFDQDWSEHCSLLTRLGITYRVDRITKRDSRSSQIRFHSLAEVTKWGDYIYQGYETDGIGLERKHSRWLAVKQKATLAKQHDDIALEADDLNADSVFDLIRQHNGQLSRRKLAEAFGVDTPRIDYITQGLRKRKLIRAEGKLSHRRFFAIL